METRKRYYLAGSIHGDEQFQSQLISDVVQKNPIKNVRINEVSTEEIVRKIYEEGMTPS